jgi:radical SAM superfamily enzyme YgiQ (UPF0313 family)
VQRRKGHELGNTKARASARRAAIVNVPYGGTEGSMRPLGPAFVVAYARAAGHLVDAYDFSDSRTCPKQLVRNFDLGSYDIVGLSFYNQNALTAYEMATEIKRLNVSTLVVAGGPHASACDERMLRSHPDIDVVVRNEGEETFEELLRARRAGLPIAGILGTTVRTKPADQSVAPIPLSTATRTVPVYSQDAVSSVVNESAVRWSFVRAPDRPRIADLNTLPAPIVEFISDGPATAMVFPVAPGRMRRATAIVTSRSCPYGCNFCAIISIGRQWRAASPEKVVADFLAQDQANNGALEHVYFLDANFFVNAKRAIEIARLLQARKPGVTFSFATRVNQVIQHEDAIRKMAGLGLAMVELGVESASPQALERFAKDVSPTENDRALDILAECGIKLGLDFIMFDAEGSLDDLALNLAFFKRHDLDLHVPWESYFNYMTPYLATGIRSRYEQLAGASFDDDVLPNPSTLIQDSRVRRIFDEYHRLCDEVPSMLRMLDALEAASLESTLSDRERARLHLNAAAIRRFYYVTLTRLLAQARAGDNISLETAMPSAQLDDGTTIPWKEFIAHVRC